MCATQLERLSCRGATLARRRGQDGIARARFVPCDWVLVSKPAVIVVLYHDCVRGNTYYNVW